MMVSTRTVPTLKAAAVVVMVSLLGSLLWSGNCHGRLRPLMARSHQSSRHVGHCVGPVSSFCHPRTTSTCDYARRERMACRPSRHGPAQHSAYSETDMVSPRAVLKILLGKSSGKAWAKRQELATAATTPSSSWLPTQLPRHLKFFSNSHSRRKGSIKPTATTYLLSTELSAARNAGSGININSDPLLQQSSRAITKISWFSWWAQVILTVISTVTLVFARSILVSNNVGVGAPSGIVGVGESGAVSAMGGSRSSGAPISLVRRGVGNFFLAGSGIALSAISIFWTWGGVRLSNRISRPETNRITAATLLRRTIAIGTAINLLGIFITVIGAEQIVGTLATKVLTMQGVTPLYGANSAAASVAAQTLQPLDILVVQGNTNTLFSHFISLACTLYLHRWVEKLDPPSTAERGRRAR